MAYGFKTGGRKKGKQNKFSQYADFHLKEYEKGPMTYILKVNERYKIGHTTNLKMRFKQCIGLCPYPIELVWTLKTIDCKKIEKKLHELYESKRIHYEWFLLTETDIKTIKKINSYNDLTLIIQGQKKLF